ncbi:MAG: winged helix-turn-helix domain-containing protein [Candidatus Saccharimonadales bacterium]
MVNPEANQNVVGVSIGRSDEGSIALELAVPLGTKSQTLPLSALLGILPPDTDPNDCFLHFRNITPQNSTVTLGDERIIIDPANHETIVDDRAIDLTDMEFRLLVYLAQNPQKAHRREALLQKVWEYGFIHPRGDLSRTVDVHVTRLRKKIGGAGEYSADLADVYRGAIATVRKIGYRGNKTLPKAS